MNFSSNINEVIRAVLNSLLLFNEKILHASKAQKSTKKYQKHQKHKNTKNITEQKQKTLKANKNKKYS